MITGPFIDTSVTVGYIEDGWDWLRTDGIIYAENHKKNIAFFKFESLIVDGRFQILLRICILKWPVLCEADDAMGNHQWLFTGS